MKSPKSICKTSQGTNSMSFISERPFGSHFLSLKAIVEERVSELSLQQ